MPKCRYCKKPAEPPAPNANPQFEKHRVPLCEMCKRRLLAPLERARQAQPLADLMHQLGRAFGERKNKAN